MTAHGEAAEGGTAGRRRVLRVVRERRDHPDGAEGEREQRRLEGHVLGLALVGLDHRLHLRRRQVGELALDAVVYYCLRRSLKNKIEKKPI